MQTALPPVRDEGFLDVGEGHRIRYAQYGNPSGIPAVSLHGGPASGASPRLATFFDPARFRVVLFDQRGCGASLPPGSVAANTTAHLVADMERLRRHLDIPRWLVCGGSWGATLALAYAARHREACAGLVLRGVFLGERAEIDWFFRDARRLLPEAWSAFAAAAPAGRRDALLDWYAEAVNDPDPEIALAAVRRWMQWEAALSVPGRAAPLQPAPGPEEAGRLVAKYRVQAHYLTRDVFLAPGEALECARTLEGLPLALVHGRLDLVCRPDNAWRVHRAVPGSSLRWVANTGHDAFATAMFNAIVQATEEVAGLAG